MVHRRERVEDAQKMREDEALRDWVINVDNTTF